MFSLERHAVDVQYKGESFRFYARELGYMHFQELCSAKYPEPRGVNILNAVVLACIENEDCTPAFTSHTWRNAPKSVAEPITSAAMKAQGIEDEKEELSGNG